MMGCRKGKGACFFHCRGLWERGFYELTALVNLIRFERRRG